MTWFCLHRSDINLEAAVRKKIENYIENLQKIIEKFVKFTEKFLYQSLPACNVIKKSFRHLCFLVKSVKILITLFIGRLHAAASDLFYKMYYFDKNQKNSPRVAFTIFFFSKNMQKIYERKPIPECEYNNIFEGLFLDNFPAPFPSQKNRCIISKTTSQNTQEWRDFTCRSRHSRKLF